MGAADVQLQRYYCSSTSLRSPAPRSSPFALDSSAFSVRPLNHPACDHAPASLPELPSVGTPFPTAQIVLAGNRIADIAEIAPLKELASLKSIDLFENPVANKTGFPGNLFSLIPGLVYVNNKDKDGNDECAPPFAFPLF